MTPVWNEPWQSILGRWGLALLVLFILFVLSAMPLEIAHLGAVRPVFMLMAVYYWTILRPSLLPPPLVFVIGIALDLVSAYPLGMHALVLVAAQWLIRRQRKFLLGQSFPVIWAGFTLVAFGGGMLQWGLFSLYYLTFVSVKAMLIGVVLSAFLFPLVVLPLSMVHRVLADQPSPEP